MTWAEKLAQFDAEHAAKVERLRQQTAETCERWTRALQYSDKISAAVKAACARRSKTGGREYVTIRHEPEDGEERKAACRE